MDERNRMVDFRTASGSGTIVSQYQYNGKGERVRKYLGGTDQARYVYNEGGQLLVQTRISGSITQEILWLDDMPIGVSQNGSLHGILADHLNTPRQVFELGSQTVVWAWSSLDDAFGENVANEDPDANSTLFKFDMRFPGQLFDSESGLHYNYFRDYEAANGRYVESDPIGFFGDIAQYAYASGNPILKKDVKGLIATKTCANDGKTGCDEKKLLLEVPCAAACKDLLACKKCCQSQHIAKCLGKIKGWRKYLPFPWVWSCGGSDFREAPACELSCDTEAGI